MNEARDMRIKMKKKFENFHKAKYSIRNRVLTGGCYWVIVVVEVIYGG